VLFAQLKRLLVNQHDLVLAGIDLLAADIVRVLVRVTIDKLLAVSHLVNNAIVIGAVNWRGRLGQQDWNVAVTAATQALFVCNQIDAMAVA
jgi:hypothetical protein